MIELSEYRKIDYSLQNAPALKSASDFVKAQMEKGAILCVNLFLELRISILVFHLQIY